MRSLNGLLEEGLAHKDELPATFTYNEELGRYVFRVGGAEDPPYRERRQDALIEYDKHGNVAGIVLSNMPPPSHTDVPVRRPRMFNWRTGFVPRSRR